jgi:hypothetical protein
LSFRELTTAKEFTIEMEFTTVILIIKWPLEGMSKDGTGRRQGGVQQGLTFCWRVKYHGRVFFPCY